ncbi:sulfatase [Kiritimatiella glycovorans]|uniref:Arylsulfatase n=1 Tax=Kiritimatiella glycovorans TaxID=1307763 RepID=A0A0G3EH36_9BACT|nr:sulfatase [Kiritimatiella glycovorans]AKJ64732.1 Arylsulfatase [Kiritimatiella glycovorans]
MKRRDFISALAGSVVMGSWAAGAARRSRPNVLFLCVDDLRPMLGCYGHDFMKTPNIDRLAAQGMVFDRSYAQFSICGPSRASMLTGLRPEHHGMQDNAVSLRGVSPDILTLPQHFRLHGYRTVGMGKIFHHGGGGDERSWDEWKAFTGRGYFDPENLAEQKRRRKEVQNRIDAGEDLSPHQRFALTVGPCTEAYDAPEEKYPDGVIGRMAVESLHELAGEEQPFFLAAGFLKPHLPLIAPKRYWNLYDRASLPLTLMENPAGAPDFHPHNAYELRMYHDVPNAGPLPEKLRRRVMHGYCACTSFIDAQVGRILRTLDELKLSRDTVIVLWGDHGFHLGEVGVYCKDTNYETSLRCPLIVRVPGMETAGRHSDALTEAVDIAPTLCELAGLPPPGRADGMSLTPLLYDLDLPWKNAVYAMNRRAWQHPYTGQSVRTDRYRYIRWIDEDGSTKAEELYDYRDEPLETRNRVDDPEYRDALERLRPMYDRMLQRAGRADRGRG